jgi:hypothetical protein
MFSSKAKRGARDFEDKPEERPMAAPPPGRTTLAHEPEQQVAPAIEAQAFQSGTGDVSFSVQARNGAVRLQVSNGAMTPDFADQLAAALTQAATDARLQAPPVEPPPEQPEPGKTS